MKKVMAIALLTMLSNWAAAAEAPLTAATNVGGNVAASQAPAASTAMVASAVAASNSGGSANGGTTAGNGAGPGSFWDLQNVQVLKGPQGTLFGRNTTGGAILVVPQKPTH